MGTQNNDTAAAILEAGKQEFLEYGYERASLRRIAKRASVTTGAIYGCFSGKEALFEALTGPTAVELLERYTKVHEEFAQLPPESQPDGLDEITEKYIPWLVDYVYDHFEVFKLLLCCGAPGAGDRFFDRLAKVEEKSCWDFAAAMEKLGHCTEALDETLVHILCRSFFQQLQEFVFHDVPREKALACTRTLSQFQHAGWKKILGF